MTQDPRPRRSAGATKVTAEPGAHKWEFKARFRQHAFGWKSQRAIQRIKQAVSEIKKVARTDPVLADSQILVAALTPAKTKVGDARSAHLIARD